MGKRIFLFLLTNLLIVLTLTVVLTVLGVTGGSDMGSLAVFCLVWGMGGAFISLQMSRWIAKRATGVHLIDGRSGDSHLDWLYQTVQRLTRQANLPMPEVGVYESPEVNAFATGPSKSRSLVAVSTGLLRAMRPEEVEGVLAHEVAHIANGDMVTMTLLQGVLNTFVIFLSRVIGQIIDRAVFRDEDGRGIASFVTVLVLQVVLGVLASVILMWFSRQREFRADRGGAQLAGTGSMIAALEELKRVHEPLPAQQFAAFGIAGGMGRGLQRLFMSHPPLDERIAALRALGSH